METYITICKIDSQREFAIWLRKLNLEGAYNEIVSDKGRMQNCVYAIIRFCTTYIYGVLNSVSSIVLGPGVLEINKAVLIALRSSAWLEGLT